MFSTCFQRSMLAISCYNSSFFLGIDRAVKKIMIACPSPLKPPKLKFIRFQFGMFRSSLCNPVVIHLNLAGPQLRLWQLFLEAPSRCIPIHLMKPSLYPQTSQPDLLETPRSFSRRSLGYPRYVLPHPSLYKDRGLPVAS